MSTSLSDFSALVHGLGASVGAIVQIGQVDQQVWWLDCDGGAVIDLEWFDDSGEVLLSTMLGPLPAERELSLCSALLQANLIHSRRGAPRLALCACDGPALMFSALAASGLTALALGVAVNDLLAESAPWRDTLAAAADDPVHAMAPSALALLA